VIEPLGEAHAAKPVAGTRFGVVGRRQLERQHDVFQRGQRRQQLERLEDEADRALTALRQRILRERADRLAMPGDAAAIGAVEPGQEAKTMARLSPVATLSETSSSNVSRRSPSGTMRVSA